MEKLVDTNLLDDAVHQIHNLQAQVQFAVDYMNDNGLLDEGCFTFPDGETVWATQTLVGENNEGREEDADDHGTDSEEEEAIHMREAQGDG